MNIYISESQVEKIIDVQKVDRYAKMLGSLMKTLYELYDTYDEKTGDTDIKEDGELVFYYDWDRKLFGFSVTVLEYLHKRTNLPIFDYTEVKTNNRKMFDEVVKKFAKDEYGFDVNDVSFHWY
jgi:hypothetical protein